MLPLLIALGCARSTAPAPATSTTVQVPVVVTGAAVVTPAPSATQPPLSAPVATYYDPTPAGLAGCELSVDNQVGYIAQLTCPGDRVLTDMRGPGVPAPDGALQAVMDTLAALGLSSMPRQAVTPLPDGVADAQVIDAEGDGLAMTTWVVHHMGTMPQVLTCMALQEDAEAEAWCLDTMAAMLLPPGTPLPSIGLPARALERAD